MQAPSPQGVSSETPASSEPFSRGAPIGAGRAAALTRRTKRRSFPAVNSTRLKQDVWKVSGRNYDQPWQMSLHGTWQLPEPRPRVGTLPLTLRKRLGSWSRLRGKAAHTKVHAMIELILLLGAHPYPAACSSVADVWPAPSCPPIGASVDRLEPASSAPHLLVTLSLSLLPRPLNSGLGDLVPFL